MTEDKSYEEIAKELQQQIDARQAAEQFAAMKAKATEVLEKAGYNGGNLDNAVAVLEPFFAGMEDEAEAEDQAVKLHHAVLGRAGNASRPANGIFKY